jgi:hypothetical protein
VVKDLRIHMAATSACRLDRPVRVTVCVFAGNHGAVTRGVSAYPQAVILCGR